MITPKRLYFAMVGLFILLIGAGIGLTVYANSWLKAKSEGIVAIKLDTAALEEEKKTAIQAESDLSKYKDTKDAIEKIIPKSKDQALAIAELLQIGNDVGANINSITFPSSDLGVAQKTTTPTTDSGDTSTSSNSSTSQTTAPQTPKTPTISQAKPVEGLNGILGVDVIVTQIDAKSGASGAGLSYGQMLEFLKAVERNRRTMQVKSIQIQPIRGAAGSGVTGYNLTLNLTIFVKP